MFTVKHSESLEQWSKHMGDDFCFIIEVCWIEFALHWLNDTYTTWGTMVKIQETWWLLVVFITDITFDCITDITFECFPKISLSSEFDTEHTGLVLFPHSQGEEGGEAGRREVWGVFLRLFLLAHIGACAWHTHASVVSYGTISTYSVRVVNFCQTLLPGSFGGQLQSHAFLHSAHGLCIIHFSSHCW